MPFTAFRLGRYELRRFRGPLAKASLIFVILVPMLYAAIYLSANWDPYGKIKNLPVAVVNHDQPARVDNKTLTAGDDLVAKLIDAHNFDWRETDDVDAADGLAEGRYYLVLSIPSDFSANLASGAGDDPQRATVTIRRDDANGYAIGNITKAAENSIVRAVDQSAQQSYFEAVFTNLATIRSGLVDAADGATKLASGTKSAHTGAEKLDTGSADAVSGAKKLSTGAGQLTAGVDSASDGADSLANGLEKLDSGSETLADGARQVANGTQSLEASVVPPLDALSEALSRMRRDIKSVSADLDTVSARVAGRSDSVASYLDQAGDDLTDLVRRHPELADDAVFARLAGRVDAAGDRADAVADKTRAAATGVDKINTAVQQSSGLSSRIRKAEDDITQLNNGAQKVASGAASLHTGIATASSGATSLAAGLAKVDTGAQALSTGADDLYDGLVTLHDGASSVSSGLGQLESGSGKLATQLTKAYQRIPVVTADQQADAIQVLASPAQVDAVVDHPATYNGRGFAPMFLAVSLWVFGISVFQVVRPVSNRILAGRASSLRRAMAAWAPIGAMSVAAGWLMIGTVWLFLGLQPVHPLLLLVTVTLGALTCSALASLLMTAFGSVGSSLLLIALLVQLSASGGTYPGHLLPPFFDAIGPYLPLTYLIDAYRVAITGGPVDRYLLDTALLAAVLVTALGLLVVVVRRRQRFAFSTIHSPTDGTS